MITNNDIKDYYRCPMLLYLEHYGDKESKSMHPLISFQRGKKEKTKTEDYVIQKRTAETFLQMAQGKEKIKDAWLIEGEFFSRIGELIKQEGTSTFGMYYYVPVVRHAIERTRKPTLMEYAYNLFLLSKLQNTAVNYVIVYDKQEQYEHYLYDELNLLEENLSEIQQIINNKATVTPNFTRKCKICSWRNWCKEYVIKTSDLTLISGIGKRIKAQLHKLGITTVPELAKVDCDSLELENVSKKDIEYFCLQAQALAKDTFIVRERVELPQTPIELFVDLEASSFHNFVWVIGTLIRRGSRLEYVPFMAKSPKEEEKMMREFFEYLSNLKEDYVLYHWSSTETQTFKKLAYKYGLEEYLLDVLGRTVDLFQIFKHKIILPVYSYTLKNVANWLGFVWHDPTTDGASSIILFEKWYKKKERQYLDRALSYNADDCKALMIVKDFVAKITNTPSSS